MKNVVDLITELKRDWEKAGSYAKANACDYILHRLSSAEPTPDATSKVLLTKEQEPRTRTLLRSMLAAFDRGDSDTYWATFGILLEVHKEVMSADTKGTST